MFYNNTYFFPNSGGDFLDVGHQAVHHGEESAFRIQREPIHLNGDIQRVPPICLPEYIHVSVH
jgi:hypothetical protein